VFGVSYVFVSRVFLSLSLSYLCLLFLFTMLSGGIRGVLDRTDDPVLVFRAHRMSPIHTHYCYIFPYSVLSFSSLLLSLHSIVNKVVIYV